MDYRDKLGRQLARVLANFSPRQPLSLIQRKHGTIVKNIDKKLQILVAFYLGLYASSSPLEEEVIHFLDEVQLLKLVTAHSDFLDATITTRETEQAINSLGHLVPDGLLAEFYRKYQKILDWELTENFSACLSIKSRPSSWTVTKIILIPKEGKDPSTPRNYGPVSLLNVDYKILTTILAKRLVMIIPQNIHVNQAVISGKIL